MTQRLASKGPQSLAGRRGDATMFCIPARKLRIAPIHRGKTFSLDWKLLC